MSASQAKVLIVGAGPTGMTAAMELTRQGIAVRLIEQAAEPATTSRAIGVQARTLELFQQRGIVQPMLDKGNRGLAVSVYGEGRRLFHLEFRHNRSEYGYILFLSQAETEGVLRDALAKEGVSVERQVEFIALGQSEHGNSVHATLKHADGAIEEVDCEYLISAEGAHSLARSTLDLQFKGKTRNEDYALGDLHVDGDLPDTDLHIFSSEHGFMGMFPMGDGHYRLIASNPISTPDKNTAPTQQELQAIYDQRSPIPARFFDTTWSSWFHINSRMVDTLRVGRVFLGGDSAHIHSPAGAQGMNTGIQDMINLCWKLALVLHGKAEPRLLDTYSEERIPVIKSVLSGTEGLTDAIGDENPIFRSVFAHLAPLAVGNDFVQERSTAKMSQLSLGYRDSPLSASHGGGGEVKPGDRVPNIPLQLVGDAGQITGAPLTTHLFELLSPDIFTLFIANTSEPQDTFGEVVDALGPWDRVLQIHRVAPATDQEARFRELFGKDETLFLVRPDSYAAFVGSGSSTSKLADYLRTWMPPRRDSEHL